MKLKKNMSPKWSNIHLVQDKIEKRLIGEDKGFIDNVKMVAGELLENSVKYYMKHGKRRAIKFCLYRDDNITISITGQWVMKEDIDIVKGHIDRINNSLSPSNLFLERLQEILDNRIKGESRLGLLRVASEGGFSLGYKIKNGKLTIIAEKTAKKEEIGMLPLIYEDLTIEVSEQEDYVDVSWQGRCRTLNPENILDTYLAKLTQYVRGKKVYISFEKLKSMNSSTVPPLLTLIKTLEENKTETLLIYDDGEDWQRASFRPLSIIVGSYDFVKIKPVSSVEV